MKWNYYCFYEIREINGRHESRRGRSPDMSQEILIERQDGVATITLNRPEVRNALSSWANQRLYELWGELDADSAVRVIVLTSADCGTFCAGMDLKEAAQIRLSTGKDVLQTLKDPMYQRMRTVQKPLIAAMTGHFTAGGMVLCLNCDLRIGLAGTQGGITESKLGRGSPWATPLLWMLPEPVVSEMVLTGELMPVERLHQLGFINHVEASPDAVRARARKMAERIRDNAPMSVSAGKRSIRSAMALGSERGFVEALEHYRAVYASEDAQEGPRAFAERRAPVWKGC